MKNLSLYLLLSLFSGLLFAQQAAELSESELANRLDSVLNEGNLLYRYEKAAWVSTDLALANPAVKAELRNFLSYETQGEIRTVMLGEGQRTCIAEYTFERQ